MDIKVNGWKLMKGDEVVQMDSVHKSFRGKEYKVLGGCPPVHDGSTGRVYVQDDDDVFGPSSAEYYPGVFDMKWVKEEL
jgi:hypothetical protein